jgi:hypothetical protein
MKANRTSVIVTTSVLVVVLLTLAAIVCAIADSYGGY